MTRDVSEKIHKYEIFINDVLKEDLKKIHFLRDKVLHDLAELGQLKNTLETYIDMDLENGFKSQMSLGCDFYVQANINDARTIFIDIGLGHYLEFSLKSALIYVEKRSAMLQKQLQKLAQDSADNKATIKLVLGGIQELQKG
ncbi:hypothetical protein R5R35_001340 [Gryllus longicercus]|uniref:Protein UXT n=1 Tax=Gryllus longicercus TaxID=2509291 RepID=A0AAN9VIF4_9ORTH